MPGVPIAGHVTAKGFWHSGRIDGCVKCEPDRARSGRPIQCGIHGNLIYGRRCAACDCEAGRHRPGVPTQPPAEVHTYCVECGVRLDDG